jgi:gamma-glutamylcyclotransferase (GGCT)/AIG2-like uncharacterized protein YtfP
LLLPLASPAQVISQGNIEKNTVLGQSKIEPRNKEKRIVAVEDRRRLFVYGTLKRGQSNHALLCGAAKIADGYTAKKMVMMNTGKFPVVFTEKRGSFAMLSVAGEIYEIEHRLISELDRLEDLGGMYNRGIFRIRTVGGEVLRSIMYVGRPHYWTNVQMLEPVDPCGELYAW